MTWYVIERTKLGAYLLAATRIRNLVQAFALRALMVTLTYGFGVALAAFCRRAGGAVIHVTR